MFLSLFFCSYKTTQNDSQFGKFKARCLFQAFFFFLNINCENFEKAKKKKKKKAKGTIVYFERKMGSYFFMSQIPQLHGQKVFESIK